jgi:putative transposase
MLTTKGTRFPVAVICIRWYAAYPLRYRQFEEMMQKCGLAVDHSSINRWAIRFLPLLESACAKHKHAVGTSWRMDATYIRVNGACKYLYRAVDRQGQRSTFG